MARGFLDPAFEYTLADYRVVAVSTRGRFPFWEGDKGYLEEFTYGSKEESKTVNGSGTRPRAHTRKLEKPTFEMTIPPDVKARFKKWLGGRTCNMIITRQKPGSIAITDVTSNWLPLFDTTPVKSGDASMVKVTGNALDFKEDVRDMLA